MKTHRVSLIGDSNRQVAELTVLEEQDQCRLQLKYCGKQLEEVADDCFDALASIRLKLAHERLVPFCYGASLNVYPSAMTRQMALGTMAYRITKGKQATSADLVMIFASGPDVQPATVEEQRKFFAEWLDSLC